MRWGTYTVRSLRSLDHCPESERPSQMHASLTIGKEYEAFVDLDSKFNNFFCRYHVIANPMGGKLTKGKAILFVVLIWCYTIPWAVFPVLQIWGRFVPG